MTMHELNEAHEAAVKAFIVNYLANFWTAVSENSTGYTLMLAQDYAYFNGVANDEMVDAVQAFMQSLKVEDIVFGMKDAA